MSLIPSRVISHKNGQTRIYDYADGESVKNFVRVTSDGQRLDHIIRRDGDKSLCGVSPWPARWTEVESATPPLALCVDCVDRIRRH